MTRPQRLTIVLTGINMVLGGKFGHVQVLSRTENPFVKIVDRNGREQVIK